MKKILFFLIIIIASALGGFFIAKSVFKRQEIQNFQVLAMRLGQNGLINPLVEYEISQTIFYPELKSFDDKINSLADSLIKSKKADTISVYFRSLNDGPWFGINEDHAFFPASLLKVPIMVAYYKMAEADPGILDKKVTYGESYLKLGDFNEGDYYLPTQKIVANETYSIEDLIEYMIKYSDNNAKNLLILNLNNPQQLFRVYEDLGIANPPELRGSGDVFSTHEYATFYRVLYNASYLSRDMSKKALSLLSETDFNKGISNPIPDNIKVAHKFGEHRDDSFKQLHDCGIVYFPERPYILCVMTRGSSYGDLESVIEQISQAVYDGVNKGVNK